jgi:hypothetical protein
MVIVMNNQLESIEVGHLTQITGGAGTFENAGRAVGAAGGSAVATAAPAPLQPIAQATLPSLGGQAGAWAGRQVDNLVSKLPTLKF